MWQAIICSGRHLSLGTANLSLNFIWLKSEWRQTDTHTLTQLFCLMPESLYEQIELEKSRTTAVITVSQLWSFAKNVDVLKSRIHTSDKRQWRLFHLICFSFSFRRALCVCFLHGHGCLSQGEKSASISAVSPWGILGNGISSSSRKTPSSTWRRGKGRELPSSKVLQRTVQIISQQYLFLVLVVQTCHFFYLQRLIDCSLFNRRVL